MILIGHVESLLSDDLIRFIFEHARLTPNDLVSVSRVCHQWRLICHDDARTLVLNAAPQVMTKTVLMGLFALTSAEADTIPRTVYTRRDGSYYYLYENVSERAWGIGGQDRSDRLVRRSAYESGLERALGSDWKRLRWLPYSRPCQHMKAKRWTHRHAIIGRAW